MLLFGTLFVLYNGTKWPLNQTNHASHLNIVDVPIPEGRVASVDPGELCACQSRRSLVTNESAEVEPEHVAGHTLMVSSCSFEADQRKDGQSIVSYSLFGDTGREEVKRRYFSSLEERAARVASAYPGWTMRIYHNLTLTEPDGQSLCHVYCKHEHVDLCDVNHINSKDVDIGMVRRLNPRMWRFLVMIDPLVDRFMSRDIDSDIIDREVSAVQQWLNSNWTFHVMRDHPSHGGFMLAGLWGAKNVLRRQLIKRLGQAMVFSSQNDKYETDQSRLDMVVWPFATFDVMAHDAYFCNNWLIRLAQMVPTYPFPTQRIGHNYTGYDIVRLDIASHIIPCPLLCRPHMHKNWDYC